MSFYVKSTPEVADYLKTLHKSSCVFVVIGGFKDFQIIVKDLLDNVKNYCIPEYKLHPVHGFIPVDSKLFKEDTNKEQKEKQVKQREIKKVFEVGDKCTIKNVNNYILMEEVKKYFIDKECKIVAKFELSLPMVVVKLVDPKEPDMFGVCVVFREEMCYPVKTEKDIFVENLLVDFNVSSMNNKDLAEKLYEAGYRKVGE